MVLQIWLTHLQGQDPCTCSVAKAKTAARRLGRLPNSTPPVLSPSLPHPLVSSMNVERALSRSRSDQGTAGHYIRSMSGLPSGGFESYEKQGARKSSK